MVSAAMQEPVSDNLYDIAALLAEPEMGERTFNAVIDLASQTLPLNAAILIEVHAYGLTLTDWSPGTRDNQMGTEARAHAEAVVSWFAGAWARSAPALPSRAAGTQFITLPLVVDSTRPVLGVLQVEGSLRRDDLSSLNAIAAQFAAAIDRNRASPQARDRTVSAAIGAILAKVTDRVGASVNAREQTLVIAFPAKPVLVECPAASVEDILVVLMGKASVLASPGARIWVSARVADESNPVSCHCSESLLAGSPPSRPFVDVTIRDDGPGAIRPVLPRIFDLLDPQRRHLDQADLAELKTTQRNVERHGGSLCAMTAGLGQGSEFRFRLPISNLRT